MAFRLKMNSLVYIHPDNEFFAQDTDSKVPIALGTNEFITVSHDVTHSLPRNTMEGVIQKTSCRDDFVYDDCVRDVSYLHTYLTSFHNKYLPTFIFLLETNHILRQHRTGWVGLENGQFC